MAQTYRLVGSSDPTSRIDRVEVERPSKEYPDGKTIELNGAPVELSDDQYYKLSGYVNLEPAEVAKGDVQPVVEQPGVNLPSRSTDPLATIDVDNATKDELAAVVPDAPASATKEDLKKAVRGQKGEE